MSRRVKCHVRCQDIITTEITNLKVKYWKENNTRYLLTQLDATSPTYGGYEAKKEIHYNSINSKYYVNNLWFTREQLSVHT